MINVVSFRACIALRSSARTIPRAGILHSFRKTVAPTIPLPLGTGFARRHFGTTADTSASQASGAPVCYGFVTRTVLALFPPSTATKILGFGASFIEKADVRASFVMHDRRGKVLFLTGPTASSDVRLRRAQALAHSSGAAPRIARELIDQKLAGQEQVARDKLSASQSADAIHRYRSGLVEADTIDRVRLVESRAAAYWSAWRTLPIIFPRKNQRRTPTHWQVFGTRVSPLTGSPRLAVNPPNAILNYLYILLESESRLAAAILGLDPGLGVLHVDTKARDSLACDLIEPVRPQGDAFLLDWIMKEPLKRGWLLEQSDGNCRLMAPKFSQNLLVNRLPLRG